MNLLNVSLFAIQSVAAFFAVITVMIIFGRRAPPPMLKSMNDEALERLDASLLPELRFFTARDGTALGYRQFGQHSNKVAVLIHGSSADSRAMAAIGKTLASKDVAAFALDMRGHGVSGNRGDICYIGQLEDDLADFVKFIRTSHPSANLTLIGHSSGGGFSLRFACSKEGTLFDRYVLAAPFIHHAVPTTRPGSGGWARPYMPRLIALTILDIMGLKFFQNLPVLAFAIPEGRQDLTGLYSYRLQANFRPDAMKWREQCKNLNRPVTVIVGEKDELFVAGQYGPLLRPLSTHFDVHVVPGLGHTDIYCKEAALNAIAEVAV